MSSRRPAHPDLALARAATLVPVALVFPLGAVAVYGWGADRVRTADVIAWVYACGLFAAFTTAFWPLPSLRAWSAERRARSAALVFVVVSYATHLSWELGWLVGHTAIAAARDAAWAYPWWAYIDGGDRRYATAPPELLTIETLSVVNGLVGVTGLVRWVRSGGRDLAAVLLLMATAVVHLYSASYYYLSEIVAGLPNVDTTSFTDTWIKFGLANAPWVTMPWVVLWWGWRTIAARVAAASARSGPAAL